jgi:hypothetical protein
LRGMGQGRRCRCGCRGQEETSAVNIPWFHGCGDCSGLSVRNCCNRRLRTNDLWRLLSRCYSLHLPSNWDRGSDMKVDR